jgi:ubiquinone/menaquinone biosynthesis C-methylase UbiE
MPSEAHYEREQAFWDNKGQEDYATLSSSDRARIVDWIGWRGNGRILDLGGGAGMVSRLLIRQPETEIVCLDISHAMLTHSPVPAIQADATRLPVADESCDLIVAAAFMHHLPLAFPRVLLETHRVLKRGGRIVGYDPNGFSVQNRIFMGAGPLRLKSFSPEERPIRPTDMRAECAAAGLYEFTSRYFTFHNETTTKFETVQSRLINPIAKGPLKKYLDRWYFWRAAR